MAKRVQDTDWTHVMLKPSTGLHGISLISHRCGIEYFRMAVHWSERTDECNRLIRNTLKWATIADASVPSIVACLSHQQRQGTAFDKSKSGIETTAGVMYVCQLESSLTHTFDVECKSDFRFRVPW